MERARGAGGPSAAGAGATAAHEPASVALSRLQGRWLDSCGAVGTIAGSTLHWAQQADDADGTTKVTLCGATVHMAFLGQMIRGTLLDDQILWSTNDIWWRSD